MNTSQAKQYALELTDCIQELDLLTQDLEEDDEDNAVVDLKVEHFMGSIRTLFFDYFQSHVEEAHIIGKANKAILTAAHPFIENAYLAELEGFLEEVMFEGDAWQTICEMRSSIEAFNVMFGTSTGTLDIDQIDQTIREKSRFGGMDQQEGIPAHTPKNHWWWFC